MLTFNDLLRLVDTAPEQVQLMRHNAEPALATALPGLRLTRPELFNGYQEWQRASLFNRRGISHLASFLADGTGRAIFAGLWELRGCADAGEAEWRADQRLQELMSLGMESWDARPRPPLVRFSLVEAKQLSEMIGRLAVGWRTRGQTWSHRADRHELPVLAIHEESFFDALAVSWSELVLNWSEIRTLAPRRRAQLAEWRGVYLIHDEADGKCYVGSASGLENMLGRWLGYAARGDGGNRLLRERDPVRFRFSILQRLSPDTPRDEVEAIEASWKRRLHTRAPNGLNAN